jgi:HAD superfamily hydrolase (TIGR01549 family)
MIKAVIFDFDDTLVESRLVKWAHHKHVAKKFYNIDLTDEDIRKHWGKPLNTLIKILYRDADTVEKMYDALISVREDFRKKTFPGAVKVVETLFGKGMRLGVLSATNKKFLVEDLKDAKFPVAQMLIQGADETDFHKPDPKVFVPMLKKLKDEGISNDEVLYIGDSMDDFLAATGAGIGFIAITTGLYSKEDFQKAGADKIVDSIEKVLEYI